MEGGDSHIQACGNVYQKQRWWKLWEALVAPVVQPKDIDYGHP